MIWFWFLKPFSFSHYSRRKNLLVIVVVAIISGKQCHAIRTIKSAGLRAVVCLPPTSHSDTTAPGAPTTLLSSDPRPGLNISEKDVKRLFQRQTTNGKKMLQDLTISPPHA
ncbi:hypothetical protein CHARACLAT_001461 [Characodon lateralis]|uniref:Uncharacterized protein n=1 Tax=Characodon lateralis TaxID=208331 RepID=A0ABU7D3X0_9TELE|nr:hypothetical protein [Characodon lateralis]